MLSAFGVDHGEVSKRKRDTKAGAKLGAQIGTGVALTGGLARTPGVLREMKAAGVGRGGRAAAVGGGLALGSAIHGGIGAGIGAAIGRKKKPAIGGANGA